MNRAIPLRSVAEDFDPAESENFNKVVTEENHKTTSSLLTIRKNFDEKSKSIGQEKPQSECKVFITNDPDLLNEYYQLRHQSYSAEWGFERFDAGEAVFDKQGKIAVAVRDGKVVGGMRLMCSDECDFLSNETPGTQYEYKKFIKKYDPREDLIIAEISSLVVAKDNRDSTISAAMFDVLFKEAKSHGCHYVFGVTVPLVCRSDRRTLKKLGYDLEIVINYPWEKKRMYNFVTMFPVYVKLK